MEFPDNCELPKTAAIYPTDSAMTELDGTSEMATTQTKSKEKKPKEELKERRIPEKCQTEQNKSNSQSSSILIQSTKSEKNSKPAAAPISCLKSKYRLEILTKRRLGAHDEMYGFFASSDYFRTLKGIPTLDSFLYVSIYKIHEYYTMNYIDKPCIRDLIQVQIMHMYHIPFEQFRFGERILKNPEKEYAKFVNFGRQTITNYIKNRKEKSKGEERTSENILKLLNKLPEIRNIVAYNIEDKESIGGILGILERERVIENNLEGSGSVEILILSDKLYVAYNEKQNIQLFGGKPGYPQHPKKQTNTSTVKVSPTNSPPQHNRISHLIKGPKIPQTVTAQEVSTIKLSGSAYATYTGGYKECEYCDSYIEEDTLKSICEQSSHLLCRECINSFALDANYRCPICLTTLGMLVNTLQH